MTIYDQVEAMLEVDTNSRERRFKDGGLIRIILSKMDLALVSSIPVSELSDFAREYESYNRAWRQVLRDREDLRGTDYHEGNVLEQEKEIELGYNPMFERDNKRLKQLSL
jgi:hypothetical protein